MGEIRFVGTGETSGYPYLVCEKYVSISVLRVSVITGELQWLKH